MQQGQTEEGAVYARLWDKKMGTKSHHISATSTRLRSVLATLLSLALALSVATVPAATPQAFADNALASPSVSNVEETQQRVIKVGYVTRSGDFSRNESGQLEGYTYDYLMRIAQFTGWKYEFIEAEGETTDESALRLLEMLDNGEVDIEGNMTYSSALATMYEYPQNSYGTAHTALFVPETDAKVSTTNYVTRGKLSVAILASAKQRREELTYFCQKNNLELTTVECAAEQDLYDAVTSGKADAFLDIDVNVREGFVILESFVGRPYYFTAPKGQRAIIDEIDATIKHINESNPTLQDSLYNQYFNHSSSNYELTDDEKAFARQRDTLRVGILSEKAPVQSFDKTTGKPTGVTIGVLDFLSERTGLEFEVVKIERSDDLNAAIKAADVDLIGGIDTNQDAALKMGVSLSAPYMTASMQIVYNKFVNPDELDGKRLAIPWELEGGFLSSTRNIVVYDSLDECFKAVNSGEADYTYGTTFTTPYYTNVGGLTNILSLPASTKTTEVCLGIVHPVEPELLTILNKSIRGLSTEELDSIIYDNSLITQNEQINLFIRDHLLELAVGCIVVLTLIIVLLGLYLHQRVKAARSVREENRRFQKLYSLANEEFFEYNIKNDTLMISDPRTLLPDGKDLEESASSADEGPYRLFHSAREFLERHLEPGVAEALTSPSMSSVDVAHADTDGNAVWLRIVSHFVVDDAGKPISVIGKITNIDDEMREKLDLSERAHHDGLTGLLNWKTFQERAGALMKEGNAGALLVIDTDDFKQVNDTYGHQSGDVALQSTADALRRTFRPQDLIGRLGGDEFAVCINGPIELSNLEERCAGIVKRGVEFRDQDGTMRTITISVGGVMFAGKTNSYQTWYRAADQALYRAKASGKDRFVIEERAADEVDAKGDGEQ